MPDSIRVAEQGLDGICISPGVVLTNNRNRDALAFLQCAEMSRGDADQAFTWMGS